MPYNTPPDLLAGKDPLMSEQKFQPGSLRLVRLKSGGPKMTVVNYDQYGYGAEKSYKCRWFDDKRKLTEDTFTEAELEAFTDTGGAVFEVV
jgi:uncharacterized protein YodC (DUF2158 family)